MGPDRARSVDRSKVANKSCRTSENSGGKYCSHRSRHYGRSKPPPYAINVSAQIIRTKKIATRVQFTGLLREYWFSSARSGDRRERVTYDRACLDNPRSEAEWDLTGHGHSDNGSCATVSAWLDKGRPLYQPEVIPTIKIRKWRPDGQRPRSVWTPART